MQQHQSDVYENAMPIPYVFENALGEIVYTVCRLFPACHCVAYEYD
jgi:hypothetical protein